jgi:hypothetical protein
MYMSLHCRKVEDCDTEIGDTVGGKPLRVSSGWAVAPGDADDICFCGAHPWQSWWLVFDNGDAYWTAMCYDSTLIGTNTRSPSEKLNFSHA